MRALRAPTTPAARPCVLRPPSRSAPPLARRGRPAARTGLCAAPDGAVAPGPAAPRAPRHFPPSTILLATPLRRLALAAAAGAALAVALPAGAALAAACCQGGGAAAAGGFDLAGMAKGALSFVLHLDKHLGDIISRHGTATYALLFGIVFCETGLVLTPFLPGDSLLFACGTFAALGRLSLPTLLAVFISAAFLGDAANYAVGAFFGARAVDAGLIKREFVAKTEAFYAKHGPRTVVLARFVPIVRTFAPFVAGVADMPYPTFSAYNAGGAVLWSVSLTLAGAAFGNLPFVKDNFSAVVLGIVAVSLLPLAWEAWAARREGGSAGGSAGAGAKP